MPKTKNNHYVPQFYISKWKFNDKQVYCLNKKESKIFKPSPRNICADRIWDDKVEKGFAQTENKDWIPVIDKILKDRKVDQLSESELEHFLSFCIAVKARKKSTIDGCRKAVKFSADELDDELIKTGKAAPEEIEEIQKCDEEDMFDDIFLEYFDPNKMFKEKPQFNQFKKLHLGTRTMQNQDTKYGQFFTSDSPFLMHCKENRLEWMMTALTPGLLVFGAKNQDTKYGQFFTLATPLLMHCKENRLERMMIALAPDLLVFGAKEIEMFIELHNMPINEIIKIFNRKIYDDSNYIVSNKKSLLEQFL